MSLLHKIRILAGALVHKPFMPRPEKVDLEQDPAGEAGPGRPDLEVEGRTAGIDDEGRVADLISELQRREEG